MDTADNTAAPLYLVDQPSDISPEPADVDVSAPESITRLASEWEAELTSAKSGEWAAARRLFESKQAKIEAAHAEALANERAKLEATYAARVSRIEKVVEVALTKHFVDEETQAPKVTTKPRGVFDDALADAEITRERIRAILLGR